MAATEIKVPDIGDFKNVEVIGEALEILERDPRWSGEVLLTVQGDEGRYARYLKQIGRAHV